MAKKNPYGGKSPNPLAKLERRSDVTTRSLVRELRSRLASIRARIVATKDPAYAKSQEELFDAIARSLERFGKSLDRHLKDDVVSAATDAARRAEDEAGALVRWDEARLKRYWRYVAPQQGKNLAAVFTDKMSEDLITSLRQSLVEVEREAVIEGWTMNEKQKAVQDRWAQLARDDSAFKFVDRSGKTWDNARYLQMLTRTTSQRVYNDALADRFAEDGDRYARITSMGTPGCKACAAWQGQIVVLAGKSRQFPTLAEARAAGVFHPNCLCTLEYIDEDIDADEIKRQRDAGKVDWEDADAVQRRADEIAVRGLRDEGMSKAEAEDALTRRKLEDALRAGLFTDDAKALADGFTRERLAEFRKKGVPRFEFTKKGDKVGWHHGSAGGVVRIDRNDLAGGLKEVFGTEDEHIEPVLEPEPFKLKESMRPSPATAAMMAEAGIARSAAPLDLSATNPLLKTDFGARDNCTHCVVAGYLRLNGYDVVATPKEAGDRIDGRDFWKNKESTVIHAESLFADITEAMSGWGPGSVAEVRVPTSGTTARGHVFLALNRDDEVFLYDPQVGNSENCHVAIANAPVNGPRADSGWILRLDGNELSEEALKCFRQNHQ